MSQTAYIKGDIKQSPGLSFLLATHCSIEGLLTLGTLAGSGMTGIIRNIPRAHMYIHTHVHTHLD